MQTIFRTPHTSNFTIMPNALVGDASLSGIARAIQQYLIAKPPQWKFNAVDIKRNMGIGLNKVYRCMRELIAAGYARYVRGQSHVIWYFYDTPQSPVLPDRVNVDHVQNEGVLVRKEFLENTYKQPHTAIPAPHSLTIPPVPKTENVVVSDLIFPAALTPVQKKAAKHVIKKAPVTLQNAILLALAYAMAQGTVKNPVAYLNGLVKRANNGTFEPVHATTASASRSKPIIPLWKGREPIVTADAVTAQSFLQQIKQAIRRP